MRRARLLCALLVAGLLLVPASAAHAGQLVFERGAKSLWAMSEDGSGARKLVDVSQLPNMQEIDSASVQPNGTEVAFVAGWSGARGEEGRWDPFALGYCGVGCLGYYELRGGALQRMTEGPAACATPQPCRIAESDARVAVDGSVAFSFQAVFGSQQFPGGPWSTSGAEYEPRLRPADGGAATKVASPCASPANILDDPAPNPANPREVLYEGCVDSSSGLEALARSGADPQDPGDDAGVVVDTGSFEGYDWRPDGAQIAFTDSGCSPLATSCGSSGLQVVDLDEGGTATDFSFVLISPSGTTFYSPRYVGQGRIAFVAGGDIWTVPASCRSSSCNFPADATRLTMLGDVGPAIGYTTSSAAIAAVAAGGGAAGGAGGKSGKQGGGAGGRAPALLEVKRAWISRGRLHVRGSLSRRVDGGPVKVQVRAAGRRDRFAATVRRGRLRVDRRLRGPLGRARLALVALSYAGSRRALPDRARLWAAPRPARLEIRRARLRRGRLLVSGTISRRARGKVAVLVRGLGSGGAGASWQARARIRRGRWTLARRLPAAARQGGELVVSYLGSRAAGVAGEQLARVVAAR